MVRNTGLRFASLYPFDELADADYRAPHRAAANFLRVIAGRYAHGIETSVERLEHGLGLNTSADAAGRAMFDVDGRSNGDLIALAIGLEGMKRGGLHQADHIRRGVHRRQLGMVRGEGVLELDGLLSLTARADGN